MTREEAQSVIMTEQKCVDRAGTDRCNRDCANCDLVMDDAVINEAYNMAIKALEQPEQRWCHHCEFGYVDVNDYPCSDCDAMNVPIHFKPKEGAEQE